MIQPAHHGSTFQDYLRLEEESTVRHAVAAGQELDPEHPKRQTVVNPGVLVEVPSPSTEEHDRGEKLQNYRQIPALAEVILVAHDRMELEVFRREADGSWSRHVAAPREIAKLSSLGCDLPVLEVHRDPLR
jgi:Uma2 family endonuclease